MRDAWVAGAFIKDDPSSPQETPLQHNNPAFLTCHAAGTSPPSPRHDCRGFCASDERRRKGADRAAMQPAHPSPHCLATAAQQARMECNVKGTSVAYVWGGRHGPSPPAMDGMENSLRCDRTETLKRRAAVSSTPNARNMFVHHMPPDASRLYNAATP